MGQANPRILLNKISTQEGDANNSSPMPADIISTSNNILSRFCLRRALQMRLSIFVAPIEYRSVQYKDILLTDKIWSKFLSNATRVWRECEGTSSSPMPADIISTSNRILSRFCGFRASRNPCLMIEGSGFGLGKKI